MIPVHAIKDPYIPICVYRTKLTTPRAAIDMVAQARIAVAFCSVLLSLIECQNLKSYDRRQVEELPPPNYNVSTANVPDQWSCFSPNFLGLRERYFLVC